MIFTQDARLTPTSNQRPRSRPQAVVSVSSPNRKVLIAADLNVTGTKNIDGELQQDSLVQTKSEMPMGNQKNQATKELEKMLKDVGNFETTEEVIMQFIENNQIDLED